MSEVLWSGDSWEGGGGCSGFYFSGWLTGVGAWRPALLGGFRDRVGGVGFGVGEA